MPHATPITYRRGTEVIASYLKDENGKTTKTVRARALRGTLEVGGFAFDTLERMDKMVCLPADRTHRCTMETSKNHTVTFMDGKQAYTMQRRQLRPHGHGKLVNRTEGTKSWLQPAAILIHPGKWPHDFLGCIGVGELSNDQLMESVICMEVVFNLCGGFEEGKEVMLSVIGEMPKKE